MHLLPRLGEAPPWQVGLRFSAAGAGSRLRPVPASEPVASGRRVESGRGTISEWYLNDERGLEHGFTVSRRPAGAAAGKQLRLALSISGNAAPRLSEDRRAVDFLAPGGALALRYAELEAYDALGRSLRWALLGLLVGLLGARERGPAWARFILMAIAAATLGGAALGPARSRARMG